ncbi:MAG: hypothetical protein J7559_22835, partial [Cohnella sp.]|nr:hypothetical protein [Cohnella sp.]
MGNIRKKLIVGSALVLLAVPLLEGCQKTKDDASGSPAPGASASASASPGASAANVPYNEMKASDSSE